MPYSGKRPAKKVSNKTSASKKHSTKKATKSYLNRIRPGAEYEAMRNGTHPWLLKSRKEQLLNSVEEPEVSYTSRIRAVGNSQGVILNNHVMEAAGLEPDAEVVVQAKDGIIYIMEAKAVDVNTDLSTWDRQYKAAIKKGGKPEKDLFEGMTNEFDESEW